MDEEMNTEDKKLAEELRCDEGFKCMPYIDTVGIPTIGIGRNMKAKPIPQHWTFPLSDDQVGYLLAEDLGDVFSDLDRELPWWRDLSYARQRVMANMCFNMGISGLCTFKNTLAYVQSGNYCLAAEHMLESKWAKQVGDRANRLALMMREG